MSEPVLLGFQAALYYGTVGTARESWGSANSSTGVCEGSLPSGITLMSSAKNVKVNAPWSEGDVSTRAGGGVKLTVQVLTELSIELDMPNQPADPGYIALRSAALTRQSIPIAALDEVGGDGWWIDAAVFQLNRDESIDNPQSIAFVLKPTLSAVPPQWVSITGS